MGFLRALLALLGGGTTSDCSNIDIVVLLAARSHQTLSVNEHVSLLLCKSMTYQCL